MFKLCKARGGEKRRPVPQAMIKLLFPSCCPLVDAPAGTVGINEARVSFGLVAQGVLPGMPANSLQDLLPKAHHWGQAELPLPVRLLGEQPLGCSAFTLSSGVLVTGSCEAGLCSTPAFQPSSPHALEKDRDAWIPGQTAAVQTRSSNWHPRLLWQ